MEGLSPHTIPVFNSIRNLDILQEYYLIGGTALSLQIQHRLSEDLDFCKWQDDPAISKREVDWPAIELELKKLGQVRTDIIDLNQVDFFVDGVKVSFYSNGIANSRGIVSELNFDRIRPANLLSLGAMKLEVMSRRSAFRDYYDIYSLLQEGLDLKEMVLMCGSYSKHRMSTKMILSILSDGSRFKYEENFNLLEPKYNVRSGEIESYLCGEILKKFSVRD